jgi:uncharacterized peroxidase-related enzyme
MRIDVLERGHDLPTRLTFGLVRRLGRAEIPDVVKVTCYRHRYFGTPFHALVQQEMRGRSFWTEGERELFAAYTSTLNQCKFCISAHAAFAADRLGSDVVSDALSDSATATIRPQVSAIMAFLDRLAESPDEIGAEDAARVREAGVPDEAFEQAVRISVLFHVINRVMDVAGANAMHGAQLTLARRSINLGQYRVPPTVRYLSRGR